MNIPEFSLEMPILLLDWIEDLSYLVETKRKHQLRPVCFPITIEPVYDFIR